MPLEFSFKMPNELDVEIEHWADAGEPTEDELRQNSIIDARLFEIEPKQAQLPEGETVTVIAPSLTVLKIHNSFHLN